MSARLALATAVVLLAFGSVGSPAAAEEPSTRNCGWALKVASQVNVLYPDEAAKYWAALLPIPPGGHIEVKGRYPRARYLSFHTYNPQLSAIDAMADVDIAPDAGSSNPFPAGADRTTDRRSYTLRMVNERIPASGRAPNTIYTENADGSKSTRAQGGGSLVIRVYEPDRGLDETGGVALPELTVVTTAGQRTPLPQCAAVNPPDAGATEALASSGLEGPPDTAGIRGLNPPPWRKHVNVASSSSGNLDSQATGPTTSKPLAEAFAQRLPSGGAAENQHNKYVFANVSYAYGAVAVIRGRAPRTPRTLDGEPVMGSGELRYWSVCSNEQTTSYLACLNDDAIPTDETGRYTAVVSTAAARPSNARAECGVAWLPAGPANETVLIMRHMLPDPGFANAIQRAEVGTERSVMGAYYPDTRFVDTTADFEREGCRPPAQPAVSATSSCRDTVAPVSRPGSLRRAGRRTVLRGRARDRGCGRIASVQVALTRRVGARCRSVLPSGRLSGRHACSRPRFLLAAATTRRWALTLPRRLPRGRYLVRSRATDAAGNAEGRPRAIRAVRIR